MVIATCAFVCTLILENSSESSLNLVASIHNIYYIHGGCGNVTSLICNFHCGFLAPCATGFIPSCMSMYNYSNVHYYCGFDSEVCVQSGLKQSMSYRLLGWGMLLESN